MITDLHMRGSDCEKAKAHAGNFEARIHRQSLVNRRADPSPDIGKQLNKTHRFGPYLT